MENSLTKSTWTVGLETSESFSYILTRGKPRPLELEVSSSIIRPKVPTVDGQPAIFYHYQLLRRYEDDLFCPTLTAYKLQPELKSEVIAKLYVPYIKKVVSKERALTDMGYEVSAFQSTRERPSLKMEASSTEARIQSGELIRINGNN